MFNEPVLSETIILKPHIRLETLHKELGEKEESGERLGKGRGRCSGALGCLKKIDHSEKTECYVMLQNMSKPLSCYSDLRIKGRIES